MCEPTFVDVFTLLPNDTIRVLDNNEGYVRLVDSLPRLAPPGRGCDFAIVRNARVSTGTGLKSIEADSKLIHRLYKDHHTSPFESVSFVFEISCPLFVAIHFIRHRTAKINMFSQRYASISKQGNESPQWYTPSPRAQSKSNHQGSVPILDSNQTETLTSLIQEADAHIEEIFKLYEKMLEAGMSREVARYCLPESCFTKFYFEMDLNNLLKFFNLRCAEDTQLETRVYALAMRDLIKPLLPMMSEFLV